MIGAGTVINPIIKIVTTVAILGAVYLFIVKPALDTTESVTHDINHTVNRSLNQANREVDKSLDDLSATQQKNVAKSIKGTNVKIPESQVPASAQKQLKIAECVQKAAPDTARMQACVQ